MPTRVHFDELFFCSVYIIKSKFKMVNLWTQQVPQKYLEIQNISEKIKS